MRIMSMILLLTTSAAAYSIDNPFQLRRVRLQLVTHCHRVNQANAESVHCPCYVEMMLRKMRADEILAMHERAIEALPATTHADVRKQCAISPEEWDPNKP